MKRTWLLAFILIFVLNVAWGQGNPVSVSVRAFIVGDDGTLTESVTAKPGDEVEYQVTAVNEDARTLPSNTVKVSGPVPQAATYISGSATESSSLRLEYSTEGTSFVPVQTDPVRTLRWTLLEPLESDGAVEMKYRVLMTGGS